jgi:hypothetical protein
MKPHKVARARKADENKVQDALTDARKRYEQ